MQHVRWNAQRQEWILDSSSSLVYDRKTKEIMEWQGPAAMICKFPVETGSCIINEYISFRITYAITRWLSAINILRLFRFV